MIKTTKVIKNITSIAFFITFLVFSFLINKTINLDASEIPEPLEYRQSDYDAPVPNSLKGAKIVGDKEVYEIWSKKQAAIIDVMPNIPRPKGLPKGSIWKGRSRYSIPGAMWLPLIGFGTLDQTAKNQFKKGLEKATAGDKNAAILFLCRANCWMSWNAAKRALEWGYTNIIWYPDGSTGWTFWEWPTEKLVPEKF